jgi:hypothetical protein
MLLVRRLASPFRREVRVVQAWDASSSWRGGRLLPIEKETVDRKRRKVLRGRGVPVKCRADQHARALPRDAPCEHLVYEAAVDFLIDPESGSADVVVIALCRLMRHRAGRDFAHCGDGKAVKPVKPVSAAAPPSPPSPPSPASPASVWARRESGDMHGGRRHPPRKASRRRRDWRQ